MFDVADLVALPGSEDEAGRDPSVKQGSLAKTAGSAATRVNGAEAGKSAALEHGTIPVPNPANKSVHTGFEQTRERCQVVEACAIGNGDIALAMSNGKLCYANMSRKIELHSTDEKVWPHWRSWPSRHGKVLNLRYDRAHDALVTLEHATTAAGDQVFLGRYHKQEGIAKQKPKREASDGTPWVGCSIPLATSDARMAVCPCRGWAAVCTGSVVNLWAVARPELGPSNGRIRASRTRQAPTGFEHALAVDLTGLVGVKGGPGKEGGVQHIALLQNVLAVATDHAVFLIGLSFDVKGETPSRRRNTPTPGGNAPRTPTSRGNPQPTPPTSTESHNPHHAPRDNSAASPRSASSVAPKSQSKDVLPKGAPRGNGPSSTKGKSAASSDQAVSRGGWGDKWAAGSKKDAGKAKSDRGDTVKDGVVEGAVLDAEDMVVCVLHPVAEDGGRGADGSAQPLPLLRTFEEDWEACRARRDNSAEPWELENAPVLGDSSPVSLPVSGNSSVVEGVGVSDVVLARRVGPGEVVKELHLLPVPPSDSVCPDDDDRTSRGTTCHPVVRPCRFVLLTSKGATVCLVCAARTAPVTPQASLALSRSSSRSSPSGTSPSSWPPSSPSTPSRREGPDQSDGFTRNGNATLLGKTRSPIGRRRSHLVAGIGEGGDGGDSVDVITGDMQRVVLLRRCCRFNNDLIRASIASNFLFVLTVEGLEVWTFPSNRMPEANPREGQWLEGSALGGAGTTLPASPVPSPRPCLLHVQKLEVDGVLPRSPARCMVSIGGTTTSPGVLLFPTHTDHQGSSLAFLAQQCRRRLRSRVAADASGAEDMSAPLKPQAPNPFVAEDPRLRQQDSWQRKCAAWRTGFCGGGGSTENSAIAGPRLALFLRLRPPTEAFRLLAAAEARAPRPLAPTTSTMFVSAAEGLHGALTAEAAAAWRAAVCTMSTMSGDSGAVYQGGTQAWTVRSDGVSVVRRAGIEGVLAGLVNCWRIQRVAARCASLIGRLLLEAAAPAPGVVLTVGEDSRRQNTAAGEAYTRACSWYLASGEPVAECFTRLQEVAACVVGAWRSAEPQDDSDGVGAERTGLATSSVVLGEDGDDSLSLSTSGASWPGLEESVSQAMYESYLLPALGVEQSPVSRAASDFSAPHVRLNGSSGDDKQLGSLDGILSGLVAYLHGQDMRRLSQATGLGDVDIGTRQSTRLAAAVVYGDRVPWTTCPGALIQAIAALNEQEKALRESFSGVRSTRSGSSGSSTTSPADKKGLPVTAKRSKQTIKARPDRPADPIGRRHREGTEHVEHAGGDSMGDRDLAEDSNASPPAQEWVAVAQAILVGYSEGAEISAATLASPGKPPRPALGPTALTADQRVLQLACERHPTLVAAVKGGAGPFARGLLSGGRARPLVSALVRLTCYGGCDGSTGYRGESFGPHRAQELLQLTGDCFSTKIDPLQALRVFGMPGRQIAARLDSLRRSSLGVTGDYDSPPDAYPSQFETLDGDTHEQGSEAVESRLDRSEAKALSAAAREFLSQRCLACLATVDRGARYEERLSQALGAPRAWRVSLARRYALDRAILRYLIGAHLDDLRALETPAMSKPKTARNTPGAAAGLGWGSGLVKTARSARSGSLRDGGEASWADAIVPLLTGQVSKGRGGPAEEHVNAIMSLVREATRRTADSDTAGDGGGGRRMSPEEAAEVVKEATRRLPVNALARISAGDLMGDDKEHMVDGAVPWGPGGVGPRVRRTPWPWGPRAVPPSAVGAVLALAAALPPAGKLLEGVDVMLQVASEVITAAKAEAAGAAGAAAASGSAGKRGVRRAHGSVGGERADAGEGHASVEEVACAAERALLLYASEYCGKDPDTWAVVTEHVRNGSGGLLIEGGGLAAGGSDEIAAQKLVHALLRRCGEELGGRGLVRALPETLDLMDCLDEVERSLLRD